MDEKRIKVACGLSMDGQCMQLVLLGLQTEWTGSRRVRIHRRLCGQLLRRLEPLLVQRSVPQPAEDDGLSHLTREQLRARETVTRVARDQHSAHGGVEDPVIDLDVGAMFGGVRVWLFGYHGLLMDLPLSRENAQALVLALDEVSRAGQWGLPMPLWVDTAAEIATLAGEVLARARHAARAC
jgi:hypothetical protein